MAKRARTMMDFSEDLLEKLKQDSSKELPTETKPVSAPAAASAPVPAPAAASAPVPAPAAASAPVPAPAAASAPVPAPAAASAPVPAPAAASAPVPAPAAASAPVPPPPPPPPPASSPPPAPAAAASAPVPAPAAASAPVPALAAASAPALDTEEEVSDLAESKSKVKHDAIALGLEELEHDKDFGRRVTNINIDKATLDVLHSLELLYPHLTQTKITSIIVHLFRKENNAYLRKQFKQMAEQRFKF